MSNQNQMSVISKSQALHIPINLDEDVIIKANFDDFNIDEDSFKPVTKGLGFHQDQKRHANFRSTPSNPAFKETHSSSTSQSLIMKPASKNSATAMMSDISKANRDVTSKSVPSGLEAFYGQTKIVLTSIESEKSELSEIQKDEKISASKINEASSLYQFCAWSIDLILIICFVTITTITLVLVSGMSFQAFLRVVSQEDIVGFATILFSIYYLLYFTVLDLTATPGKSVLGIRLLRTDNRNVTVKNTFIRSLVTLLSFIALFLPMLIDFQGRLSDTKVVK